MFFNNLPVFPRFSYTHWVKPKKYVSIHRSIPQLHLTYPKRLNRMQYLLYQAVLNCGRNTPSPLHKNENAEEEDTGEDEDKDKN
jgi:hypothetical protein